MKKLPIAITSFSKIRQENYAYVDKTLFIEELVNSGGYYFLSRPRRFGKSLLLDTIACAFQGRRDLFEGLYLTSEESSWDWQQTNPVLRIDWTELSPSTTEELDKGFNKFLSQWYAKWDLERPEHSTYGGDLASLVRLLHEKTGRKVVILVDEYDKPILNALEDKELALKICDGLRNFYGTIKALDEHLQFVMLTGVTKFAKAGIFSQLNNLEDISVTSKYSALCGYRQDDLETVFKDYLAQFDKEDVRQWYNGYSWCGDAVYNPYDVLLLFRHKQYKAYWFETGTPYFLVQVLQAYPRTLPALSGLTLSEEKLGSFSVQRQTPEAVLFQAGYLTIKDYISNAEDGTWYTLDFPNREVRTAFSRFMLEKYSGPDALEPTTIVKELIKAGDITGLKQKLDAFFASISYNWHVNNPLAKYEGYYASVIYAYFASLGYEVIPEDVSNRGRADLTVKTPTNIWVFEFKVQGLDKSGDKRPLEQIRERGYADKYLGEGLPIYEVGIIFDKDKREITVWESSPNPIEPIVTDELTND